VAIYLEDYTPVRTVELSNLTNDFSVDYIKGFFESSIGSVERVEFLHSNNVAHVTFTCAEDAAE
jgi:hypothetical protein